MIFADPEFVYIFVFEFPRRTNPHLPDMPIVYASDAFMKLTGTKTLLVKVNYSSHANFMVFDIRI
jgi:hypothetical protein